ncbi:hypothetical protein EMCG_06260 [[Emmonsia] crescens]|uniref:Hydrophobin n=1 Tax=[Emmonsia] crescens TaxID=73230 RepID=A0A0G2J6Y8_9EURO|nr:hypothetical protein EMCG_06260 [Emmonsia crescens UAMH 3008]
MPSLTTLLLPLLLALYTTPTSADSCIGTKEINLCCPGSLFGGLIANNGKPTAHGICCIDPSTLKRRSIDTNIINIINEDILPLNRREDNNINVGVTTCSENQILVPLSATDYEQQVASIVASITGGSSSIEPTNAATNKAQDSSATTSSTGGMPAATGQGSYLAAIGGAVAAAVLVAGAL